MLFLNNMQSNNAFEYARYKPAGGTLRQKTARAPQFNRYKPKTNML